jgi:hypothetical protein
MGRGRAFPEAAFSSGPAASSWRFGLFVARQQVVHTAAHSSRVLLPVVGTR